MYINLILFKNIYNNLFIIKFYNLININKYITYTTILNTL